jgi:hypothetical protein
MRNRPPLLLATAAIVVASLVAACGSSVAPAPSGKPVVSIPPVASPSGPPPAATPDPATPTSSPARPTAEPPAPAPAKPTNPTQPPAPKFTAAEKALLAQIRPDARKDCAPRRSNLPKKAIAGVECRPSKGPAARVGFYAFPSDRLAAQTYFDRLAEHGVKPLTGDCHHGAPGDLAWTPGDGERELEGDPDSGIVIDGYAYVVYRDGCFVDDEGTANIRVTCGGGVYVGVLGRTADLRALSQWTETNAPGLEVSVPSAPGICYFQDGLIFPDVD